MITKLIFVYNAGSGVFNSWLDSAHKLISPSTYNCAICALTHGVFKEKEEWIRFRESEPNIAFEFLHKDEFLKKYPDRNDELPVIFKIDHTTTQPALFMTADDLKKVPNTSALIALIKHKLS